MTAKTEFIKGLRDLADFLEDCDTAIPFKARTIDHLSYSAKEDQIAKRVKLLGHCEKFETRDTIGIRRRFGPITIQFRWYRNTMCKKVKVGEHIAKGRYEHVYVEKPTLYPEYKWVCPKSFLSACCED